jgi:uncharacterized protein YjiS (DUF1127 family)
MSTGIVANTSALLFAGLSRSAAKALLRIWNFVVALRHRQELRCLLASDNHRLADIGIGRNDLRAALSEPLWRDPTAALARRMRDQAGHSDGDIFPNAAKGERRKQCVQPTSDDHRPAVPTCPAVLPSMDLERHLAALDRKSLRAQLRRRARRPQRCHGGTHGFSPDNGKGGPVDRK